MQFEKFLDSMQKMFDIFRDKGKMMADSTQVRELLRRVQHPQIQDTVKALEVKSDLDVIKYSEEASHLTTSVSKMLEYQVSWKISRIQASGGNSGGNSGGDGPRKVGLNIISIYSSQRKFNTVYYQNWKGLSGEDRKTVIASHKKKVSKSSKTASKRYVAYTNRLISELSSTLT